MTATATFLAWSVDVGLGLILIASALAFVRVARGPSLLDRVMALDMMAIALVSFCALLAIRTEVRAFLDIAVVLALVGFLSTAALARFAERRGSLDPTAEERGMRE
ncbi:monovalent cation/H+ antiporter complex subunit F [Rubellimicrobium sp. CFH 75288]|uniref:monovalent cation/H+ antiporter complex subunit F n=1 Tax=Rubellimicrobium sp. CFH 75288 TaxID=2697034 RepID=UPI001412892E|nr:monovalent cation/H+ antiporter complex subunit F [Rubellimicrobium sp. CFH 75288]NAZ35280.1 pH regulation protein F [Rubellimicrobium sp. CFH 75288]